jgi:uncharacterized protein (TIGR02284 family)
MVQERLTKILVDLISLDFDAASAYEQAVKRIEKDEISRTELANFKADHERHVRDLIPLVRKIGGAPPSSGDYLRFLTQGRVVIASIAGDLAILRAMRSNEDMTTQKYEEAVVHDDMPADVRIVLERNLADERRHRAWIETRIAALSGKAKAA